MTSSVEVWFRVSNIYNLSTHFGDADYDLCFTPGADEYDGLNGRPTVKECASGCLSLGYMIKNKNAAGNTENYEYFIERGCKDQGSPGFPVYIFIP